MNDIERRQVQVELSEEMNEKVEIDGFYSGMSQTDRDKIEDMVNTALENHKPQSAKIDHIQIRFDNWSLPNVTIWTKSGLDIEENRAFTESGFVNGRRFEFNMDIRPF